MSNSANSDEIDEVMSSVRKLVTKGDKKPSGDGDDTTAERLILTPALRVDSEDADRSQGGDNVLVLDPGNRTELEGLEATIAELEAAVTAQPDEWEADEGEVFDEADWAVSAFATPEPDTEPETTQDADVDVLADTETDVAIDTEIPEAADAPDEVADLPESAGGEEPEFKAGLSDFLDPSNTIDQDVLRDMIVQIVREELSGETGERITRNVRKLVRREINQLLATRGLD